MLPRQVSNAGNYLQGGRGISLQSTSPASNLIPVSTAPLQSGSFTGNLIGVSGLNGGGGNTAGTGYSGGGGGTTYSAPNYSQINADAISRLTQSQGIIQNALNRLPSQLDVANRNIDTKFNQRNNELDSTRAQNENSYNTSTTQNKQSLRTNKNAINDQSSAGLHGLLRLLGSFGAVGSDMGLAGQAVTNDASQKLSGAGQTYSQNQQGLDTNWNNFLNSFTNEKKNINDWASEQHRSALAQSETTKQDLKTKLGDIVGQIAAARGGSYTNAAQPYLDEANSLSGQIDQLGLLNPTYTGQTPVYTPHELASYNIGNPAQFKVGGGNTAAGDTPFLSYLLGNKDKKVA